MKSKRKPLGMLFTALIFSATLITLYACNNDDVSVEFIDDEEQEEKEQEEVVNNDTDFEVTDWTTETHGKDAEPNFSEVFADNVVKRIDIVFTEERWQIMLNDMTDTYGSFGSGGSSGGPGGGGPGGGGPGGGLIDTDEDPVFVPAEVFYNGKEWYRVGVRFKGNSSLQSTWQRGNLKLSFKLDFDEFEDDYPQIDNQRFYGFKKLHLKNNYDDKSMLREKVAGDTFRNFGLAASHTAFYTVYIDYGNGPTYFGVYTMVEDVENTVLDANFSSDEGNLYKPDGDAASFANGTFDVDEYEKKNNEEDADFSDVQNLLLILHDNTRTSAPETWRTNLEAVFDTDVFLKYLAVNTVIQNWDTYGRMTHNYYLYSNPDNNKLTWIPWDNNEALQDGKRGGALSLDFSELSGSSWPLIGYLYEDDVYKAKYDTYVEQVVANVFSVSNIQSQYAYYSSLLEPYANSEISGYTFIETSSDFQNAVNTLNSHVALRNSAVNSYLGNE
ncbi:CotH kinase family protein [Seonamhaeicola sp. ML3]|uniref:CotH kinase family protein n=1 Tax=Seonamhaeicola sp. ML3 TaxID=2937786 RepID=UPI00200BD71D|nr:CotH kinase family protein [Seonamhaeicola sp. ML3]